MDGKTTQILMVEDSADDVKLLLAELERQGFAPLPHRVETRAEFLAALQQGSWDAIIADYVLPQFSGPEALKLFRNQRLDIPFIMVSGVFGEEKAVTAMLDGADDYIIKGDLSRLGPALERELEAAQDRRRRKRAAEARLFLVAIVESSDDAIYGTDLDSRIVSWNPAAERLFGYRADEIIGHSIVTLFPRHRRDEMLEILAGIRRGEILGMHETERLRKSGRIFPVSITISPIKTAAEKIVGASSIARDISRQKQAEFENQQLIKKLSSAANQIKTLTGLLPICASCKSIRDDQGCWQQVEAYFSQHSAIVFSHGLCPQCTEIYQRQVKLLS
jgi:PAS domain S-box-containing protein